MEATIVYWGNIGRSVLPLPLRVLAFNSLEVAFNNLPFHNAKLLRFDWASENARLPKTATTSCSLGRKVAGLGTLMATSPHTLFLALHRHVVVWLWEQRAVLWVCIH